MSAENEHTQTDHDHEEVPLHRESLHDDVHGGGHGGAEMGWLVSYADMMTLLFGLFVILFTLATNKKGDYDQIMREVSNKFFSQTETSPPSRSSTSENTTAPMEPAPTENLEKQIAELKEQIETQKKSLSEREQTFAANSEKVQSERLTFEEEKKVFEKNKKDLERKLASVSVPQEDAKEVENLRQQLADTKTENEQLRQENAKGQTPQQNYMMILLTWETEKHDLDLKINAPNQKTFNFKKRKFATEPGEFTLDSRYGPGTEVWKAENFLPGQYRAKVSLYNQNGNLQPAKAFVTIITNLSTYKSPTFELKNKGDEQNLSYHVDDKGNVVFDGH